MAYGLSFQPSVDQTPSERQSTLSALGPGQKALKILSLHLPSVRGAQPTSSQPRTGLSPEQAVFQALVQTIQGEPAGGSPTTRSLVDTFANLSPSSMPTRIEAPETPGQALPHPALSDAGPDLFSQLVSQLGGLR